MTEPKPFDPDLVQALQRLTNDQRLALHRVAKTRAYAFFRDPYAMICLRRMIECHD